MAKTAQKQQKQKRQKKLSRLSPAYLAHRHVGPLFMFLTLGLLGGMAYRALVQPTGHRAEAEAAVRVVAANTADTAEDAAAAVDWESKNREWAALLRNRPDSDLFAANLRYAVKASATREERFDAREFGGMLPGLAAEGEFAASLFNNQFLERLRSLARLGPTIAVGRNDIAPNMDFQSLAATVADLDPPAEGAAAWDFSFYSTTPSASWIVARPGPDDRAFAVFFRLHEYLKGVPAPSPAEAWRTAVDELSGRLEREAGFTGGGGFGSFAKREIMREIAAIPVLAANGLYRAASRAMAGFGAAIPGGAGRNAAPGNDPEETGGENGATLSLHRGFGGGGVLSVSVNASLNPVLFRRDTAYTRIQAVTAATLIAYAGAYEEAVSLPSARPAPATKPAAGAAAKPVRETIAKAETEADFVDELEPLGAPGASESAEPAPRPQPVYREVVDEAAAAARLARIAGLEKSLETARLDRDASLRTLKAARDADNRVSREALAARARADSLHERYDAAVLAVESDNEPKIPAETALLFKERDEVFARLKTLLQYCTEEHPFVRQARRELAALEERLAGHSPDAGADRMAEERATRVANLHLEWEAAVDQADTLEERARRQTDEVTILLNQVTECERRIIEFAQKLADVRESPVPTVRQKIAAEQPKERKEPEQPEPDPVPEPAIEEKAPAPEPPANPAPQPVVRKPYLAVDPAPGHIALTAFPPDFRALYFGLAAGCCLGLLSMILREILANRFRNESEAARMTGLPVLAALPAYDARSFREAAKTMKGEAKRVRADAWQFIPAQVETSEPPAGARRGKIHPAATRPRFLAWLFGLLFLLLAGLLYYKSMTGFAQPDPPASGELSLPEAAIEEWKENGTGAGWGDLP